MKIENIVQEESFKYTEEKPDLLCRSIEIGKFGEIYQFCVDHNEKWTFSDKIWYLEIEKGVSLLDWMYSNKGKGKQDDRSRLMQYFSKISKKKEKEQTDTVIEISLGEYRACSFDLVSYYKVRRKILAEMGNANEFLDFMDSCFDKIIFSKDVDSSLKAITNFDVYIEEIVNNLSTLNDYGLAIFNKNCSDPKKAMDELSAIAGSTCSPESRKNFQYCKFSFSLEEVTENNEKRETTRNILCSPHLKLLNDGSNLRIYFNWNDPEIGKGEKILVGRIGGHPYRK